jgi:hypothetical protein
MEGIIGDLRKLASLSSYFLRGAWIYLMNLVSGEEVRLVEGLSPHLSPRGESVVFVSVKENEGIMNRVFPPAGRLRLLDLRTKEIRDFKATHDSRVGDAIWSNGGLRIAFTMSGNDGKDPQLGLSTLIPELWRRRFSGVVSLWMMRFTLILGHQTTARYCFIH